jgi:nanoRNase/pAp phosphatase (c-di-AMP/oligoRNAs hydrolase)
LRELGLIDYIGKSTIIIGHHNADPDAVGAAQGVKELIQKLRPSTKVEVMMPEDISKVSRKIIDELSLNILETSETFFDTLILVDSSRIFGDLEKCIKVNDVATIIIDHHTLDEDIKKNASFLIHDEKASSTCEIVYLLYQKYCQIPSIKTAKALLAGIIFDTKYLSIGDSRTFEIISKLLENIEDISIIRSMLRTGTDISERIAKIKTVKRSEIHRLNDWLIVFSEVGSYQASGARALISLGADFALVIGSDKHEFRASLRSTRIFHKKTGIHLGKLVSKISSNICGSGSGHPTAAGFNGKGSIAEFREIILRVLKEKII